MHDKIYFGPLERDISRDNLQNGLKFPVTAATHGFSE